MGELKICIDCMVDWNRDITYCPVHDSAPELYEGLKAAMAALKYVEDNYMPSHSAASEMWSFVNGYEGSPDVEALLALVEVE